MHIERIDLLSVAHSVIGRVLREQPIPTSRASEARENITLLADPVWTA